MRSAFLILCCIFFFVACRAPKHTYQPPAAVVTAAVPQMIFLSFRIQRDSTGGSISLVEKKAVEGKIKAQPSTTEKPDRLVISIVGKTHLVLNAESIPHPLFRDVETTNARGEYERKKVSLKEAEFFVRMRLPEGSEWVLIEEFVGDKRISSAEYPLK